MREDHVHRKRKGQPYYMYVMRVFWVIQAVACKTLRYMKAWTVSSNEMSQVLRSGYGPSHEKKELDVAAHNLAQLAIEVDVYFFALTYLNKLIWLAFTIATATKAGPLDLLRILLGFPKTAGDFNFLKRSYVKQGVELFGYHPHG